MNKLFRLSTLGALPASPTLPMAMESAAVAQVHPRRAAVAPVARRDLDPDAAEPC